jgi:AcrR family transcriptional regulator
VTAQQDNVRLEQTLTLLWGSHSRPVGRTGLTINDFVAAAIALVKAEGVDALSMRNIAGRLGVRAMAAYSFAPGKSTIVALMVDRAYDGLYPAGEEPTTADWRSGLRQVAEANRALHRANPWLAELQPARSPMGPRELLKHELELAPLDGVGLSDFEMDQALAQLLNLTTQAARLENQAAADRISTGIDDVEWWVQAMPVLERMVDPQLFPLTVRIGRSATEARNGTFWGDGAFDFGVERLLDGIETLILQRRSD